MSITYFMVIFTTHHTRSTEEVMTKMANSTE